LLDFREKKRVEPETILVHSGTVGIGKAPDTSVLEPSTGGYVEVPDIGKTRHAKTFV
jgi:hypothetical protein